VSSADVWPIAAATTLGVAPAAIASVEWDIVMRTGTDYEHLAFWQYDGDGESYLAGYPREAPGCGKIDISAMVMAGGLAEMRAGLRRADSC